MFNRDSEIEVCSRFVWNLWYELNPRVRCAFGNVYYKRQWNYHLQSIDWAFLRFMFPSVKDEQIVQLPFAFDLFYRGLIISGLLFGDQPKSIKGVLANNRNCSESWSQIEMAAILWAGKLLDYLNAPDLTLKSIKSSDCNCLEPAWLGTFLRLLILKWTLELAKLESKKKKGPTCIRNLI